MSANTELTDKLKALDEVEVDISNALLNAGHALQEMSREKLNTKQVESYTSQFLKSIENIESGLSDNIKYLTQITTNQPHEGSNYAAQKDLQMALHRYQHVQSRVAEMDRQRQLLVKQQVPLSAPSRPQMPPNRPNTLQTRPILPNMPNQNVRARQHLTPQQPAQQAFTQQQPSHHLSPLGQMPIHTTTHLSMAQQNTQQGGTQVQMQNILPLSHQGAQQTGHQSTQQTSHQSSQQTGHQSTQQAGHQGAPQQGGLQGAPQQPGHRTLPMD